MAEDEANGVRSEMEVGMSGIDSVGKKGGLP